MQKMWPMIALCMCVALIAGCATQPRFTDGPPNINVDVSRIPNATPRYLPKSKFGNPRSYVVYGRRYYVLNSADGYNRRGIASWYGSKFHGQLTSTREPYNMFAMTAASPVLPIPCFVRVTNLENDRQIIVKVNDRGPFAPNRIIDLSYVAAKKLGYLKTGTALVQVTAINENRPNLSSPTFASHRPELYLQIGAFSQLANAEELKSDVSHYTNKHIRINTVYRARRPLYRVQIGPLIGVGESDRLQQLLAHKGLGDAVTVIS